MWATNVALSILFAGVFTTPVDASDAFLASGEVTKEDVEENLLAELAAKNKLRPGDQSARLAQLEAELRPMFVAVPKNADNRLDHSVVRYVLHRLLVQRHGWFIKGLEPDGAARNVTSTQALQEWVPSHLQDFLERRSQGRGLDFQELVAFAATLEDLVHKEAMERLDGVYNVLGLSKTDAVEGEDMENLVDMYLMIYLMGGNKFEVDGTHDALLTLGRFKKKYTGWREVEDWAREVQNNVSGSVESADYQTSMRIAEEIGLQFGTFNDVECRDLKATLLGIEDKKQGRVPLRSFYRMGLHTHWSFTEKVDYLRALGALDDSDPAHPSVIVPNYLGSRPQCLESSNFYAVCCRNECEGLMASLERQFAEPFATPVQVADLVSNLGSDTVVAPRKLADALSSRLDQIAATHNGKVPLHSRLFAQWMHHAFPRECPFPHEAGTINPQTPDEWIRNTGQESTQASEDEMVCYVSGSCSGGDASADEDLPWSDAEELLVGLVRKQAGELEEDAFIAPAAVRASAAGWVQVVERFNFAVRGIVLALVATGLALASRLAVPKKGDGPAKMSSQSKASWLVTLLLFVIPLLVVSIDYFANMSAGNEFMICCLCWAVATMVIAQLELEVHDGQTLKQLALSMLQPRRSQLTECFV